MTSVGYLCKCAVPAIRLRSRALWQLDFLYVTRGRITSDILHVSSGCSTTSESFDLGKVHVGVVRNDDPLYRTRPWFVRAELSAGALEVLYEKDLAGLHYSGAEEKGESPAPVLLTSSVSYGFSGVNVVELVAELVEVSGV